MMMMKKNERSLLLLGKNKVIEEVTKVKQTQTQTYKHTEDAESGES